MSEPAGSLSTTTVKVAEGPPPKKGWRKLLQRAEDLLTYKDKGKWLEDMRGSLSMATSLVAAITFQSAINPPGGVLQANYDPQKGPDCVSSDSCPGQAVLAVLYPDDYVPFLVCNTVCFAASLSVCLLLVSGLPLNRRFPTWLLIFGMCIAVISLALTYLFGALLVTPEAVLGTAATVFQYFLIGFVVLLGIISLLHVIRCFLRCANRRLTPRKNEKISTNSA